KKSGVLGVSGLSSDFRDLENAARAGHERARLALEMFAYRVRRYIGAFVAAMNGVDAVVFTAGLGENGVAMRARICEGLEWLGTGIDPLKNQVLGQEAEISVAGSAVKLLVIPTNEELMIARDTKEICQEVP
ncbi:MAG TPA: acetate kinase, partial [Firmicutes bacterium]|nr:acetate kinase [Bacillota bacterium]